MSKTIFNVAGRKIDVETMAENLVTHFGLAGNYSNAQYWYHDAHEQCAAIGKDFGLATSHVAGVVAILSPQLRWEKNIPLAVDCLNHVWHDAPAKIRTFRCFWKKACLFAMNENPELVTGPKVSAFWHNLTYPDSPERVTIDRHAIGLALDIWESATFKYTPLAIRKIEAAYKMAAAQVGMVGSAFQAQLWILRRDLIENGIM